MKNELKTKYIFSKSNLISLIIPLIIEQFLAVAVGMADSIMVSSVGESAVSAVSLVDSINILLINVFAALATGGAVVAGQYIGENREDNAKKAGEQLIVFITLISIGIMTLMYVGKGFILNVVFGAIDQDVANYANSYLMIVFASIPFIAIYNGGAALFRSMGNSKVTMKTSFIMNAINVVGNAILIYGFRMGVEGVAIPTLLSRVVAALIIMILLRDPELVIHIDKYLSFKYDRKMVRNILRIGIPNGIENSMFQLGKIMLLSVVSTFGTAAITANAVANSVTQFQNLPGVAIGLSLVTVVSQCVGAKDYEQARYYTKLLHKYAYISLLCMNAIIFLVIGFILKAYNLSAETADITRKIIIFYGINGCLVWPLGFTLPNTLRAANDVRYAMTVSVASMWIVRIGLGVIFAKYMGLGVFGAWMGMICDWYVRSIFFVIRYRGNKWEKSKELSVSAG
ncbi:MATE family efflux transporter [Tissierella sp. Yu-01]|uniref:MATE family efflux transporter n=1 Tax=Tissierella sp. Yu-01 TaxID=3035694 RepID=UPI00240E7EE1|nr:MATE family efflux transporter [Tissierella sp. Yu-01]WFA08602.1 MATE family efflux transporter [Tissierella sp. Yu-01]